MADIIRVELRLPRELVVEIDEWRRRQADIPNRQRASQRLIERGIEADRLPASKTAKPAPKRQK